MFENTEMHILAERMHHLRTLLDDTLGNEIFGNHRTNNMVVQQDGHPRTHDCGFAERADLSHFLVVEGAVEERGINSPSLMGGPFCTGGVGELTLFRRKYH